MTFLRYAHLFARRDRFQLMPAQYISLHIRRADFAVWCQLPVEECFPPLSAYVDAVQAVRDELLETRGLSVEHVIVTSDERDPDWWQEIAAVGWSFPDHSQTSALYGKW